jgi:hypothetical protein
MQYLQDKDNIKKIYKIHKILILTVLMISKNCRNIHTLFQWLPRRYENKWRIQYSWCLQYHMNQITDSHASITSHTRNQQNLSRMVSSGLLRRVALVRTDVSEEPGASIRVRCEEILRSVRRLLVAACVVPSSPIFVTLMKEAPGSS